MTPRASAAKTAALLTAAPPDRPQAPPPFVGHARVVDYFSHIGPQHLAHAYLLHGPRGVGKSTFARILALTLHCERPKSFPLGYCGECAACRRGIAGSSGDTIIADLAFIRMADQLADVAERKTDAIGIETSRLIVRLMQMRSYEGGRLACIIPNFENVPFERDEVYNVLLKELEEPDAGKIFLLTCERPDRILSTIRSRSVLVRFDALSEDEIAGALRTRYGETPARAQALAKRSMGSLGQALLEREGDGAALREMSRRWAVACMSDPLAVPQMPSLGTDEPRATLKEVLRHAKLAVRDIMATAVAGESAALDVELLADYRKALAAMGTRADAKAARALAAFAHADRLSNTTIQPAAVLGWLQVQLRSAAAA
jgi:hypothetical protein